MRGGFAAPPPERFPARGRAALAVNYGSEDQQGIELTSNFVLGMFLRLVRPI